MISIPYRELRSVNLDQQQSSITKSTPDSQHFADSSMVTTNPASTSVLLRLQSSSTPNADHLLLLPRSLPRNHRILRALAQGQVLAGLVCLALGALYVANRGAFGRVSIGMIVGVYFILTGLIGLCGSMMSRRGLIVAFVVMSVHSLVLFTPAMMAFSTLAMVLDRDGCYFQCDLFGQGGCKLLCEGANEWDSTPNESSRLVDIGLISMACVQFLLALLSAILSCKSVCESCESIDRDSMEAAVRITTVKKQVMDQRSTPLLSSM